MIQDDPNLIEPTLNHLRKAFFARKSRPVEYRKQQLENLLRGIKEMTDEFYVALSKDLGYKDKFFATFWQIGNSITHIEHTISHIHSYNKVRKVDTTLMCAPAKSFIQPEPYGVVLVMGAWNYPFQVIYYFETLFTQTCIPQVATAISAGNAVILKPSELSPNVSNAFARLFKKYLDNDLYQAIEGGIEVAKAITRQKFDLIIFTGGTEKGKLVAKAAAENLVPCILELGGKSPAIVDGSGDLSMAARRIVQTKFVNAGQTCIAPDFILLNETFKDQFLAELKKCVKEFFSDKPEESQIFSRMINEFHTDRVSKMLTNHQGEVIIGGQFDMKDKYIAPTVIYKPKLDSDLMMGEIFGPILPVVPYKSLEEAINLINSRDKPLALYYFGQNQGIKDRLINETSSGGICFNDCIFHAVNPNLPFGGVGASGYGSLNGKLGFDQCAHLKPILDKSTADGFPSNSRYPPYTDQKKRIMNFMAKVGNVQFEDIQRVGFVVVLLLLALLIYKLKGGGDL